MDKQANASETLTSTTAVGIVNIDRILLLHSFIF